MSNDFTIAQMICCSKENGRCENCPLMKYPWAWSLMVGNYAFQNMMALRDNVLEPARERYGKPIRVVRGYQCEKMTRKLKLNEEYSEGRCVDIVADATETRIENLEIARAIVEGGIWDVMILENVGEEDYEPEYVHVSYARCEFLNRRKIYLREKGKWSMEEVDVEDLKD